MTEKEKKELLLSVSWKSSKAREIVCLEIGKKYQLTQNEIDVLSFLIGFPNQNTAKDIAHYRVISKSLICKSVKNLTARNFIESRQDTEDKRVFHLYLTDLAMPVAKEIEAAHRSFMSILYSGITEEDDRLLVSIINKISENLDNYLISKEK